MYKRIRKNIKLISIVLLSIIIFLVIIIGIQLQNQNIKLPNISNDIPLQATENYTWTQDKTSVTNGQVTLEVGSKIIGYEANGVSDWYVLGAENGSLLLTTDHNVETVTLYRISSNVNGVSTLNNKASAYKNSELSTNARSINVNDINRVTGYNPSIHAQKYGENYFFWYGNTMTYTFGRYTNSAGTTDNIQVKGTKYPTTAKTTKETNRFYYPSGSTRLGSFASGSQTFTSTLYKYYPQTLSTTPSTQTSINGSSLAYNLLFANTSGNILNSSNNCYWLANNYIETCYGYILWGLFGVSNGMVKDLQTGHSDLPDDVAQSTVEYDSGLRPVVTLNRNVKVSSEGEIIQDKTYKVKHYLQDTNLTTYSLIETEEGKSPANTIVTATPKEYKGYTEDKQNINRLESGTVVADGSLELQLYYNRNNYTVTLNKNEGTVNSGNITSYTYGIGATLPTDVVKPGYTFGGWYDNSECVGTNITTIGTEEIGDKTYYAKWTANLNTPYKVKHYKQQGTTTTYTLAETEVLTAPTDTTAIAIPKQYIGYIENTTAKERKPSGIVLGDGSLELVLIYDTIKYTVIFKDGENVAKVEEVSYGTSATAPILTKQGYVLRWDKDFNNVTSDLTVNAIWLKDTDGDGIPDIEDPETLVNYKIEHYKQNIAQNGYDTPEIQIKQGNLGTTVTAEVKQYQGFNVVTKPETITSGTIVDDGSLTLKLYYDRNTYTVTFYPNYGTINEPNYITEYTYGIGGVLPTDVTKLGYTFGGWYDNAQLVGNVISQITDTDIGDKTYYASWIANGNTPYKVLHYKQTENGYILEETDNLTAQTDTIATAIPKNYVGYAENVNIPERIPSGTVQADGSLELKLYYDKISYTVIFKDGETILDEQSVNYGEGAIAPTPTKQGYVLRWDREFTNVTSNLTVNAIWLRDTDGDGIPDIEDEETLVQYIVRHYKQQGNTNKYELADTEEITGQLGTIAIAVPKQYEGYVENTNVAERIPSGEITAEEKLELRLFYDTIKLTVIFKDGETVVDTQTINYGESATAPTITKEGYILSWDKDFSKVTSNLEVNAVWTKIPEEQAQYKIEHYVQTEQGKYILKETENLIGNIGDIVTAQAKIYEEYILDETNKDTIKTGEIKENEELVLKLYYNYKKFEVIFKDGDKEVGREEVIYGGTVKPPVLTKPGYILSWDKDLNNITKNQIINAVWKKDPNYKNPNEEKEEQTPNILPKTGEETLTLGAIMGVLGIAIVYFVKYKF